MEDRQKKYPVNAFKLCSIIFLLPFIFLSGLDFKFNKLSKPLGINFSEWILGFLITIIVAYVLHYIVYDISLRRVERKNKINPFLRCWRTCTKEIRGVKIILFFISPDYVFARIFKDILNKYYFEERCNKRRGLTKFHTYNGRKIDCRYFKNDREYECEIHMRKRRRKLFVLCSNWANIILVSFVSIFIILFVSQGILGNPLKEIMFTFVVLHTFSRVFEICYAFYNDVVSPRMTHDLEIGERLSTLKKGNRISLAVHSYVEVTLLFAIIYFLDTNIIDSANSNNFFECLMYSGSVSAFNFSFNLEFIGFEKLIHIIQVFTNITLVVLSIANYLGLNDSMSEYEKADWEKKEYI
ncbi:hypothetical protein [Neobacillus drentensis]|uniref:hypothetical protein n=1 Tax=Neobacillus drentensis TaxID=220684 RepID=UPI000825454B|nr:hypothetical protein [Neobacillus drentensis]